MPLIRYLDTNIPSLGERTMSCHRASRFLRCMSLVFVALLASIPATAQVVSSDFEDGTTDGWGPFGNPAVTVSNAAANTGTNSLLTTNRTQPFEGPGIDLTKALTPGQSYVFKVAARIAQSQTGSTTLQMTML